MTGFNSKKYYKEVMVTDKEYEKVLNMYIQDLGITTKIHMEDYDTLEELKKGVTSIMTLKLNTLWNYYFDFCIKKLQENQPKEN